MTKKMLPLIVALTLALPTEIAFAQDNAKEPQDVSEKMPQFHEHMRKGKSLFEDDQLQKALTEFEAAYAIAQKPLASYFIARIHHKLGHRDQAIEYYEKYMKDASEVEPERKSQIEKFLSEQKPAAKPEPSPVAVLPGPSVPPPPMVVDYQRNTRMLAAGAAMLGASYLAAAITGLVGVGYTYDHTAHPIMTYTVPTAPGYPTNITNTLRTGSGVLLIPVAGPIASAAVMHSAAWGVPFAIIGSGTQIIGLGLAIAGGMKRKVMVPAKPQVAVLPYSSGSESGLVAVGQF